MTSRTFLGGIVCAFVLCAGALPASALPTFSSGSFAFSAATSAVGDLQITTLFVLDPVSQGNSSPTGDFLSNPPPATVALPNAILDITVKGDFDFSDAVFGAFTASSIGLPKLTVNGSQATWNFDVTGSFVPGTGWSNAGANFTASEDWRISQTGGRGNTISMHGIFQSPGNVAPAPASVPEPATLTVLVLGVLAAGALRARKKKIAG